MSHHHQQRRHDTNEEDRMQDIHQHQYQDMRMAVDDEEDPQQHQEDDSDEDDSSQGQSEDEEDEDDEGDIAEEEGGKNHQEQDGGAPTTPSSRPVRYGPHANRHFPSTIIHSPERDAWLAKWSSLYEQLGVPLPNKDPILGGKVLDIYILYNTVQEHGGFYHLTETRGWKDIPAPFRLSRSCTNAAFICKRLYTECLYVYEWVEVLKKSLEEFKETEHFTLLQNNHFPAKVGDGERKRRGRKPRPAVSPNDDSPAQIVMKNEDGEDVIISRSGRPQRARKSAPVYAPDPSPTSRRGVKGKKDLSGIVTLRVTTSAGPEDDTPKRKVSKSETPNMTSNDTSTGNSVQPHMIPGGQRQHQLQMQMYQQQQQMLQYQAQQQVMGQYQNASQQTDERFLFGGWKSKIMLGLASSLPNEMEFAYAKFLKLTCTHNIFIHTLPDVLELMTDHMNMLLQHVKLDKHSVTLCSTFYENIKLDNFPPITEISLLNLPTASNEFMIALAKAMTLPPTFMYLELKHLAYDIFDNLSYVYALKSADDFFLGCLKKAIYGHDRHLIIIAVQSLSRLAVAEFNHKTIASLEAKFLSRLMELTMSGEEEVVLVVLDFLYQLTSISGEAGAAFLSGVKYSVPQHLIRFVKWRGAASGAKEGPGIRSVGPVTAYPNRPTSGLNPKERSEIAQWCKLRFLQGDKATVLDFATIYKTYCSFMVSASRRPVSPNEFIEVLQQVFSVTLERRGSAVFVHGLKLKFEANKPSSPTHKAAEISDESKPAAQPNGEDTIIQEADQHDASGAANSTGPLSPFMDSPSYAPLTTSMTAATEAATVPEDAETVQISKKQRDRELCLALLERTEDVCGVPLTALLILRNLSRNASTRGALSGIEKDLASLVTIPKFSRLCMLILAELSVNL